MHFSTLCVITLKKKNLLFLLSVDTAKSVGKETERIIGKTGKELERFGEKIVDFAEDVVDKGHDIARKVAGRVVGRRIRLNPFSRRRRGGWGGFLL